ncbi:MAG: hypothetical protein LBT82_02140 [Oscillospiraceae bacterium]|jgi:hypothetical protein|nr:hypothetical protein [Oscillospiraceae bacterium]
MKKAFLKKFLTFSLALTIPLSGFENVPTLGSNENVFNSIFNVHFKSKEILNKNEYFVKNPWEFPIPLYNENGNKTDQSILPNKIMNIKKIDFENSRVYFWENEEVYAESKFCALLNKNGNFAEVFPTNEFQHYYKDSDKDKEFVSGLLDEKIKVWGFDKNYITFGDSKHPCFLKINEISASLNIEHKFSPNLYNYNIKTKNFFNFSLPVFFENEEKEAVLCNKTIEPGEVVKIKNVTINRIYFEKENKTYFTSSKFLIPMPKNFEVDTAEKSVKLKVIKDFNLYNPNDPYDNFQNPKENPIYNSGMHVLEKTVKKDEELEIFGFVCGWFVTYIDNDVFFVHPNTFENCALKNQIINSSKFFEKLNAINCNNKNFNFKNAAVDYSNNDPSDFKLQKTLPSFQEDFFDDKFNFFKKILLNNNKTNNNFSPDNGGNGGNGNPPKDDGDDDDNKPPRRKAQFYSKKNDQPENNEDESTSSFKKHFYKKHPYDNNNDSQEQHFNPHFNSSQSDEPSNFTFNPYNSTINDDPSFHYENSNYESSNKPFCEEVQFYNKKNYQPENNNPLFQDKPSNFTFDPFCKKHSPCNNNNNLQKQHFNPPFNSSQSDEPSNSYNSTISTKQTFFDSESKHSSSNTNIKNQILFLQFNFSKNGQTSTLQKESLNPSSNANIPSIDNNQALLPFTQTQTQTQQSKNYSKPPTFTIINFSSFPLNRNNSPNNQLPLSSIPSNLRLPQIRNTAIAMELFPYKQALLHFLRNNNFSQLLQENNEFVLILFFNQNHFSLLLKGNLIKQFLNFLNNNSLPNYNDIFSLLFNNIPENQHSSVNQKLLLPFLNNIQRILQQNNNALSLFNNNQISLPSNGNEISQSLSLFIVIIASLFSNNNQSLQSLLTQFFNNNDLSSLFNHNNNLLLLIFPNQNNQFLFLNFRINNPYNFDFLNDYSNVAINFFQNIVNLLTNNNINQISSSFLNNDSNQLENLQHISMPMLPSYFDHAENDLLSNELNSAIQYLESIAKLPEIPYDINNYPTGKNNPFKKENIKKIQLIAENLNKIKNQKLKKRFLELLSLCEKSYSIFIKNLNTSCCKDPHLKNQLEINPIYKAHLENINLSKNSKVYRNPFTEIRQNLNSSSKERFHCLNFFFHF